ncbi:MAG TPA: efflux RND transporter permease subunit [Caulobacteraceae bacterium]|nr:efflux RND transporter permease subunit [Caulobacteraceae bacterium]
MNFNQLSSWSIRNPIPILVLFLVLTVAGLFSFQKLRINNFPDVDFPAVSVTVAQPGAAPTELETQVARIVEDAVSGLGSVRHIRSTVNDGVSNTMIEFQLGTDLDRATNDVRNAVTGVRGLLPADVEDPTVQRIDITGGALISYVVSAPGMSPEELSWFVDNTVAKRLLSIDGVGQVQRDGGVDREVRVRLDPDKLAAQGITAGQVSQQLRNFNVNLPGGRTEIAGAEQSVRTLGSAGTIEELRQTRIDLPGGRSVRLADLGEVDDSWADPRGRARLDGQEVVGFGVLRSRGSSEVDVAEKAREAIAELDRERADVTMKEVTASVDQVIESYDASIETLGLGALLAVFVVWIFLRDWRATLIAALAMPLSLIPTFWVMDVTNQSFNVVTLLALSLTVGILVDDAIVEIENIVRHMREGKDPYPAALEAADEIGLAVVATTATLVAVFAPTGFMPGVVGQFFKAFAVACCVSVLFSLLVARTLTPLMGAYLLRRNKAKEHDDEPRWMPAYQRMLRWCLGTRRNRVIVMILGTVFFFGSFGVASLLPFEFIPPGDVSRSVMSLELPPGSTLDETDAAAAQVTNKLLKRPEVEAVYSSVGSAQTVQGPGGGGVAGDVRRATLTINLVPRHDRKLTQQQFEQEMNAEFAEIPGARVRFGADGSNGGGIQIALVSDDPAALQAASQRVETEMRQLPQLANVASTANLARPEILIEPKADKAALLGVSAASISQAARVATLGDVEAILPKFNLPDRQIPIRVMLNQDARADLSVIENLRVPTASGGSVPLSAVADVRFGAGPLQIDRLDRRRTATIQGETKVPLGEALNLVHALPSMKNLPAGVQEVPSGDAEAQGEMLTGFLVAILTGILLMYVVLVLLFRSFATPITILAALPVSFGGAFFLLLVTGKAMSMPALIGMIMLTGIAAKNSILLVEYAIEAMRAGMGRTEALLDAAHKRARPIIMTTLAMGAGMAPIAAGMGADVAFRSPMAVAVIGGLVTSTLLSLLFVPVAFTFVDTISAKFKRRTGKLFAAQGKEEPAPVAGE